MSVVARLVDPSLNVTTAAMQDILSASAARRFPSHFASGGTSSSFFGNGITIGLFLSISTFNLFSHGGTVHHLRLLAPTQRHFFLERLLGLFGSLAFFADLPPLRIISRLIPRLRLQYESPLEVPGRIRSPPPFALPACPYDTLRVRPVFGFRTVFAKRLPLAGFAIKQHRQLVLQL